VRSADVVEVDEVEDVDVVPLLIRLVIGRTAEPLDVVPEVAPAIGWSP
jgi:hypothetical protein